MLGKSSKWELGFVHYIAKFTISRFAISRFECMSNSPKRQDTPRFYGTLFGAKALNGSLGPRTRVPNDRTQMLGPKYRDPNSQDWNVRVPSAGTHRPRTQMKGPRCWDPSVF